LVIDDHLVRFAKLLIDGVPDDAVLFPNVAER
jgi:hypothetical protein